MRVCVLMPVFDAFKGGNHLPLLAACRDVQFTILTNSTKPKSPELPPNVTVETLNARLGPYYYGIADRRFGHAVLHRYPVSHSFWKQFDVLHLNLIVGTPLIKLRKTGRPIVYVVHHPLAADRDVTWQESSGFTALLWRLKYWPLVCGQRAFCRTMANVLTVSQTVAQRIIREDGASSDAVTVVPNGVDGSVFTPADLHQSDFDVIAIGSLLHPRKGFRYLLQAYQALAAKGFRIADVGRRSDEQQTALRKISDVTMFGMVEHDQLLKLLQRSSALISTSLYEGFGLSLIEALACGRPAFAFDSGATKEVLDPVDPSLIVPIRDVDQLVARVEAFLRLPVEERVRKGNECRQAVLKLYPLENSAGQLKKLYETASRGHLIP